MTKSSEERPSHQGHHTHRRGDDIKTISRMEKDHLNPVMAELRDLKADIHELSRRLDDTLRGRRREVEFNVVDALSPHVTTQPKSPDGIPSVRKGSLLRGREGSAAPASGDSSLWHEKDGPRNLSPPEVGNSGYRSCSRADPREAVGTGKGIGKLLRKVEASARGIRREKEAAVKALRAEEVETERLLAAIREVDDVKRQWMETRQESRVLRQQLESADRIRRLQKDLIRDLQAVEADLALAACKMNMSQGLSLHGGHRSRYSTGTPLACVVPTSVSKESLHRRMKAPRSKLSSLGRYGFESQGSNPDRSQQQYDDLGPCGTYPPRGRRRRRRRRVRVSSSDNVHRRSWRSWVTLDNYDDAHCLAPCCSTSGYRVEALQKANHTRQTTLLGERLKERPGKGDGDALAFPGPVQSSTKYQPHQSPRLGLIEEDSKGSRIPERAEEKLSKGKKIRTKSLSAVGDSAFKLYPVSASTMVRISPRSREAPADRPSSASTTLSRSTTPRRGFLTPTAASAGKVRRSLGDLTGSSENSRRRAT